MSVGSLYYHVAVLGDLVTQDERKRYLLTDAGVATFRHLKTGPLGPGVSEAEMKLPIAERLGPILSGGLFFQGVSLSPLRHIGVAALIVGMGTWLTSVAGLDSRLLFLFESRSGTSPFAAILFAIGWVGVYAVCDVIATTIYKSRGGHVSLLVTSAYALLPLILFALMWLYHKANPLGPLGFFDGWPLRILFFVLQAWTLLLLASSIRIAKRLTLGKAFIIVLLFVYLNIAFILLGRVP